MTNDDAHSDIKLDAENPWPGLHEFDEHSQSFFNGREEETRVLLRLVRDAPLTVLFGRSGLGKTSLLQAGLFPCLRQEQHLPIYIRLDPRSRGVPLIQQASLAFQKQLEGQGVDHQPFRHDESLWEYLHRVDFELWSIQNRMLTPVFVFDQFEEVFTLGAENTEAVLQLFACLSDLIENRIPGPLAKRLEQAETSVSSLNLQSQNYKVLLSFREDFLPDVEGWRKEIPSISRNRLRLLPMNGNQAFDAVFKTGGEIVDKFISQEIVFFVAATHLELEKTRVSENSGKASVADLTAVQPIESVPMETLTIEPALLSLVCTGLNERRKSSEKKMPRIESDLLQASGSAIVAEFYKDCVSDLPERIHMFIENELITERGFRNPYPKEDALCQQVITEPELKTLTDRRLLRVEPHMGTDRIELIHDLLTNVVREFRDRKRDQQKHRLELQKNKRLLRRVMLAVLLFLGVITSVGSLAVFSFRSEYAVKAAAFERMHANSEQLKRIEVEKELEQSTALKKADEDYMAGIAQIILGNHDNALTLLNESFSTYKELGEDRKVVITLIDMAKVRSLNKQYDQAKSLIEQAGSIAEEKGDLTAKGLAIESLASFDEQHGKMSEALELYAEAYSRYNAAGALVSSTRVLERLATYAEEQHEHSKAAADYRRALASYTILGDQLGISRVKKAIERVTPWGNLVNLKTGAIYQLRGDRITLGRNSADITNDINFPNQFVSRRHLVINRDGYHADDLRSRNGTSVNGQLLPYGLGVRLVDGDIITLANCEVLYFKTTKIPLSPPPPASVWAIFLNGMSKTYEYLTGSEYSLRLTNSGISLEPGLSHDALLTLRHIGTKIEMMKANDDWSIIYEFKKTDYVYESYTMPAGQWFDAIEGPLTCVQLSNDGTEILKKGPSFQLVLFRE